MPVLCELMRRVVVGVLFIVVALGLSVPAYALRLAPVMGGFSSPVHIASNKKDPGGTLFVVEQGGRIWRVQGGSRTLFLNISGLVTSGGEQGLLSVAFDPRYATNRYFYVDYTNTSGDTRVARFRANAAFTQAVASSRRIVLSVPQPYSNHNGGQLAFGPNGRLYVGMGDGGSGCDPGNRAQNLSTRLGKLLSLDPRSLSSRWRKEGYGLRNPWRFSFDRAKGRLYIGDVGQDSAEEVDTRRRGALGGTLENYGWNVYEGRSRSGCPTSGLTRRGTLVWPINSYSHAAGRCSITGGFAYRGSQLRQFLRGWYFFGDYCSGEIWRLLFRDGKLVHGRRLVLDSVRRISSFGEGRGGELYVADHGGGTIYKLVRS
jgi:glucose/arabinose dehydrogenase